MPDEKKTEEVKLRMGAQMFADVARLATAEDRPVSEYIRHVLALHVYGAKRTVAPEAEDA
jgi:hypothetical protein